MQDLMIPSLLGLTLIIVAWIALQQKKQDRDKDSIHKMLQDHHTQLLAQLQNMVQLQMQDVRAQLQASLQQHAQALNAPLEHMSKHVHETLKTIGEKVDQRLDHSFKSSSDLFNKVITRLATIDEAQKRMSELNEHVMDLQAIFNDKRARGAMGEMQLLTLLDNALPTQAYSTQFTLSNGKRVDCVLHLPDPIGLLPIDAKFPLEGYQQWIAANDAFSEKTAQQNFRKSISKHIDDIASKYIIPNETADGALMFIPAEAIFAEIHSRFPELVEQARKAKVWLVSPATMMAVLTTAQAVLKDVATREQMHVIQRHLRYLSQDFARFNERMDQLARHIEQAHADVDKINTSKNKIVARFEQIEKVELSPEHSEHQEHVFLDD
jgi:DNA recombination protein RmuC